MNYYLFKKDKKAKRESYNLGAAIWGSVGVQSDSDSEGERWNTEEDSKPTEQKLETTFVAKVNHPSEIATHIQKDPFKEYILVEGIEKSIKVSMPIHINGAPLHECE